MSGNQKKEDKESTSKKDNEDIRETWLQKHLKQTQKELHETREMIKDSKPEIQSYQPYVWNNLFSYTDTSVAQQAIEGSIEFPDPRGYCQRRTAIRIVDPEESLLMDTVLNHVDYITYHNQKEPVENEENEENKAEDSKEKESPKEENTNKDEEKSEGEDPEDYTTPRLPRFHHVTVSRLDVQNKNKELNWSHVAELRREIYEKHSSQSKGSQKKDYKQTMRDWDKLSLDDISKIKDPNLMRTAIIASKVYLGTTPGSLRAARKKIDAIKPEGKAQAVLKC